MTRYSVATPWHFKYLTKSSPPIRPELFSVPTDKMVTVLAPARRGMPHDMPLTDSGVPFQAMTTFLPLTAGARSANINTGRLVSKLAACSVSKVNGSCNRTTSPRTIKSATCPRLATRSSSRPNPIIRQLTVHRRRGITRDRKYFAGDKCSDHGLRAEGRSSTSRSTRSIIPSIMPPDMPSPSKGKAYWEFGLYMQGLDMAGGGFDKFEGIHGSPFAILTAVDRCQNYLAARGSLNKFFTKYKFVVAGPESNHDRDNQYCCPALVRVAPLFNSFRVLVD